CTINPQFRAIRLELRTKTTKRLANEIRRLQRNGLADPLLDSMCTARALISMVTHFVYMWLAMGEIEEEERVLETLTHLWVNAIGLERAGAQSQSQDWNYNA